MRAASNPFVTMIGHMTGRQLLRRPATRSISSGCWRPAPSTAWRSRSTATRGGSTSTGAGTAAARARLQLQHQSRRPFDRRDRFLDPLGRGDGAQGRDSRRSGRQRARPERICRWLARARTGAAPRSTARGRSAICLGRLPSLCGVPLAAVFARCALSIAARALLSSSALSAAPPSDRRA